MANKHTKSVGSIAIELGYSSAKQVEEALEEQRSRKSQGKDRAFIGMIMKDMGALTPEQLFQVLSKSGDVGTHISEDAIRLASRVKSNTSADEKIITITSAAKGEGVTTVATQLATALALMINSAILLVDTNVHEPRIHTKFGIQQAPGFTDIAEGHATLGQACTRTEIPGLWVLPAGNNVENFLITLMNDTCSQIIKDMRDMPFRYIIIDAAPILGYSDAALTAARSDAAILVVRSDKRRKSEVVEMQRLLEGLNVNILGSVLRK